jgi:polysaccharide biosynthesis transport protein
MLAPDTRLAPASSRSVDTPLQELVASSGYSRYQRDERDVREYLSPVFRHKWLILTVVLIATSAAAVYAFSLPPIYESSAVLQMDPKEFAYMEDNRGMVLRSYNDYDDQNTQIHLLSNPHLLRQVVLQLDLEHRPGFLNNRNDTSVLRSIKRVFLGKRSAAPTTDAAPARSVETNVNDLSQERIRELEPYVGTIASALKVQPVERTNLVTVSIADADPQVAMQIVDTLTKTFVSNTTIYQNRGSQQAAETLSRQISEIQVNIKQAEDARLNYLKSHNLPLEKGDGRNLTADRLAKLSSQLLDAENDRKQIEANYEAAKETKDPSAVPSARSSQEIQDLRKSIHQLEQKRTSLLQTYTPEWPEVKKVESEIRELQNAIGRTSTDAVATMKSQLDAAVKRETKLRDAYYKERGAANVQTQDEVALSNLNQQIEINRQVYNTLYQRLTEMQVNSLDKSVRVGIVTPAVVPTAPVGPARSSKVIIIFIVSLMGGIGLAFLIDQFDNTLKSAEDVATHVALPTLALIPAGAVNGNGGLKGKFFRRIHADENHPPGFALSTDVRSPTAEAYRHLLASLLFTAPGRSPRTILVTSGSPLEGKTTISVNTALTFAQTGAKVLLIDCDLRRPRVHRHLGLENGAGLTTYLSGREEIDSLIQTHEPYPNLKVITAGPMPTNPADFLTSTEMRILLKVVGDRFDHVVIDSPPAISFADASIVATLVDGVVIVAHGDRTSRRLVRRVKQRLESVGANVYGVVLNQVNPRGHDYLYEYYNAYEDD